MDSNVPVMNESTLKWGPRGPGTRDENYFHSMGHNFKINFTYYYLVAQGFAFLHCILLIGDRLTNQKITIRKTNSPIGRLHDDAI